MTEVAVREESARARSVDLASYIKTAYQTDYHRDPNEPLETKPALSSRDLATGQPHLVNVFASWCVPCITEVKVLAELKARGASVEGIAIRDRPEDLAVFLARNGDPYERIGDDPQSVVQIALGSSGVPESFVVDGAGVIRYQHIGPIEAGDVPMIRARLEQAK